MKIVVTGAEGFIGPHLAERLRCLGHEVHGIDLKSGEDVCTCDLPEADLVYHLAAQTDAQALDAEQDARTNIMGLLRILGRYGSRVVFASSSMVNYPVSPYAISKLAGEHYCRIYGASVVRLCNIFGPGGHSVIDRFGDAETLTIRGDGSQVRSYEHVSRAVDLFCEELGDRQALRVLIGVEMSVLAVAAMFPNKPRVHVERSPLDLVRAPQVTVG